MRKITIKSLEMANFKGVAHFRCDFTDRTTICGANGTGKSTIMDAFTWCLFGKDAHDRTDSGRGSFGIKTTDKDGNDIARLEHWVNLQLDVDGKPVEIRRALLEKWVKRRGSTEVVFDGNETRYYWSGVEIKKSDYDRRIAQELINDTDFKVLTNPHHFCNLPWEQQKQMLARIIGDVSYRDIIGENPEFAEIYKMIEARNLVGMEEEFRKSIQATMRKAKEDINATTHQIEGMKAVVPEMPNVEELTAELGDISQKLEEIENVVRSRANIEKAKYEKISNINRQISELRAKQSSIKEDEIAKRNAGATEIRAKIFELEKEYQELSHQLTECESKLSLQKTITQNTINTLNKEIEDTEDKLKCLRIEFLEERDAEFDESTAACPVSGQHCDAIVEIGRDQFIETKRKRLEVINQKGRALSEEKKSYERQLKEATDQHTEYVGHAENQLADLKKFMAANELGRSQIIVPPIITDIDVANIPAYMIIEGGIDALEKEIQEVNTDNIELTDEQKQKKKSYQNRLAEINAELGKEKMIKEQTAKIEEREDMLKKYTQILASAERIEDILCKMRRAVDTEIENRCKSEFAMVRFRLSDTQINGGEVATCYAMVDGVRYADLNSAKKVNAGLDIINAMCRHLEVSAPIFIDNAEGINHVIETESQMVKLVVTTDPQLIVK